MEINRIIQRLGLHLLLILIFGTTKLTAQETTWANNKIDLSNILSRKDSFLMKQNGKTKGYWVWETLKTEKQIKFKDISVLEGVVEEQSTMIFDLKELVTKKVDLKLKTAEFKLEAQISRNHKMDMLANYQLSGNISRVKKIDTTYSKEVILRPEIFGLISGIVKPKNLDENLDVFFLSSGAIEPMTLKYTGEEKITVPAGAFETYKINLEAEEGVSNMIYITKQEPHIVIRVDVLGQEMEIVKINQSTY
nr:DUF3108 domain-containing protein [uncultured Allomuricauda sp.]